MIKLEKLLPSDFDTFKSWITHEEELAQFAGPMFSYPLTDEQLLNYINDGRRISHKVVLTESGQMIGHCELNFEDASRPRLSRILIGDKEFRNKGLGKLIVNAMLEKVFIERDFQHADLYVFEWNQGAINCYRQIGFSINEGVESMFDRGNEIWKAINMGIDKEVWLKKMSSDK